jgi:hypothetical protein
MQVIRFEVLDIGASARLAERLAGRWSVELDAERGDAMVVLVELGQEAEDLGLLLREVESWVEEESLVAIRCVVDGRAYVVSAGEAEWPEIGEGQDARDRRRHARLLEALEVVDRLEGSDVRGVQRLREELGFALRLIDQSS